MVSELKYYYGDNPKVMLGDIIEFPDKQMMYNQTDLVGIIGIKPDEWGTGWKIKLSDGYEIMSGGSEFWKARLIARKITC